jgi:mediator of RNA polymerase II transcription subunit 14
VPPPELTSADILKIYHNLNAQLSIRLGLHENIPPYFRGYKIASGRATFTAKDEFEVDLSISDDNPKSQFYVIDVRPIYEPAIRPLPMSIFKILELQGNHILFERGLEGIFDFLHNYFLTTKIETLHRQVSEMRGGRWSENLNINQHKRTLVIQYWPQRSGEQKSMEKSWIEVGIKRGIKDGPSRLGARWVREGQEMKDMEVPLDVANLSAEKLVKTTISMHTKHILKTLQLKLYSIPLFKTPGTVTFVQHPTDSLETYLKIQLTPSKECKVLIEPITGRFAIQKPSEKAAKLEMDINNSPIARAAEYVSRFRGLVLQEEVEQRARSMGWDVLKFLQLRKEELKPHFPTNTQYLLYIRRRGWLPNWVIAFVLSDTGESWWATQMYAFPLSQYPKEVC